MKLSDYMQTVKLKDDEIAQLVGRERSTVTRWRLGKTRPDWDAIEALERVTKGAVTARDFMSIAGAAK